MPDSRKLVFLDNGQQVMNDFRNAVTIATNLKIYIEQLCKQRERIDCTITAYLKQLADSDSIVFKDHYLNKSRKESLLYTP